MIIDTEKLSFRKLKDSPYYIEFEGLYHSMESRAAPKYYMVKLERTEELALQLTQAVTKINYEISKLREIARAMTEVKEKITKKPS